jgi:hypothetical protein
MFGTIDPERTQEYLKLALTNIGGVLLGYITIYLMLLLL